jgi:hypothetical protein
MSSITIEYKKPNVSYSIENEQDYLSSAVQQPLASTITIENDAVNYDIQNLNKSSK